MNHGTGLQISAIIPAAGASSRMRGTDKLLCTVCGIPLLKKIALEALESDAAEVIVALPPGLGARRTALSGLDVAIAEVENPAEGMSKSIACAMRLMHPDAAGAAVILPDMPEIRARHISLLISRFVPGRIVQACNSGGVPGNPVILPRQLFSEMLQLTGDTGARLLIRRQALAPIMVALPGRTSSLDLDTPGDWVRWRRDRKPDGAGGGT